METLFSFAQSATPIMVIALLAGGILWLSYMAISQKKVSTTQDIRVTREEELTTLVTDLREKVKDLATTVTELRQFQTNHSMHEIPEIRDSQNRQEKLLHKIDEKTSNHQDRLTQIETIIKIKFDL